MKLQFKKRRFLPVALAVMAVVALSGVAYAFWTSGGSGPGSAQAGTTIAVTVNQTGADITGLYPGGPAQPLSGDFTNPNTYSVSISAVTAIVSSVTGNPGTCPTTDFAVGGTSTTPGLVPTGTGGSWSGLTIRLTETGINQDGCKAPAKVHLTYTAVP